MNELLFELRHPVDGKLTLMSSEGVVELKCRWPFDLDADDWIAITNRYRESALREAATTAAMGETSRVEGLHGGTLTITKVGPKSCRIEFDNGQAGFMRRSLELRVHQSPLALVGEAD